MKNEIFKLKLDPILDFDSIIKFTREARWNLTGFPICIRRSQRILPLFTVFSRLNAGGVYLKLGFVDPAFIRGPAFIY